MVYDIKAIPTTYKGVNFRSRLEARWAAFFDLNRWQWDYEPIDLSGWAPDFKLTTPWCPVFAEVKPVDSLDDPSFDKAIRHWKDVQVLLLGLAPEEHRIGCLMDPPSETYHWSSVHNFLDSWHIEAFWREAGNVVQWRPA